MFSCAGAQLAASQLLAAAVSTGADVAAAVAESSGLLAAMRNVLMQGASLLLCRDLIAQRAHARCSTVSMLRFACALCSCKVLDCFYVAIRMRTVLMQGITTASMLQFGCALCSCKVISLLLCGNLHVAVASVDTIVASALQMMSGCTTLLTRLCVVCCALERAHLCQLGSQLQHVQLKHVAFVGLGKGTHTDSTAARASVVLLAVTRQLCAQSAELAALVGDAGLFDASRTVLLSPRWSEPQRMLTSAQHAELLEHLRIWHACATVGADFLPAEQAFPCMLHIMQSASSAAQSASYFSSASNRATNGTIGQGESQDALLALAAAHELCNLLSCLVNTSFASKPAADAASTGAGVASDSKETGVTVGLGFAQQLLPLLSPLLQAMQSARSNRGTIDAAAWPAPDEWAHKCGQRSTSSTAPQTPRQLHPLLSLPSHCIAAGARNAALALAADLVASRAALDGASIVADRSAPLADLLHLCPSLSAQQAQSATTQPALQSALKLSSDAAGAAAVVRLQLTSDAVVQRTPASADSPLRGHQRLCGVADLSSYLLQSAKQAARALLKAAARLHWGRKAPRRLRTNAAWAAARLQCAQVHGASLVRLVQAWLHANSSTGSRSGTNDTTQTNAWLQEGGSNLLVQALIAVPTVCGPTAGTLALQAFQLLWHPTIAKPVSAAGGRACRTFSTEHAELANAALAGADLQATIEAIASEQVVGQCALLQSAYSTAWAGCDAANDTGGAACSNVAGTASGEQQKSRLSDLSVDTEVRWSPQAGPEGLRLPAPPDWFLTALATPSPTFRSSCEGTATDAQGQGLAAVLAAAVTWLCGLLSTGVLALSGGRDNRNTLFAQDTCLTAPEVRSLATSKAMCTVDYLCCAVYLVCRTKAQSAYGACTI